MRGIFYIEYGRYIEPPYEVEFFALTDEDAAPIIELIKKFGDVYAREPGIVVRLAVSPDDQMSSVFSVEIWERFKMYAFVTSGNA